MADLAGRNAQRDTFHMVGKSNSPGKLSYQLEQKLNPIAISTEIPLGKGVV
jgi:hypothetical protein